MGVDSDAAAVYGHKLSTVVPGSVSGEAVVHELADVDLVMKLHYVRTVYYFEQHETIDGLTIVDIKKPMFPWLNSYFPVTGRIRRTEAGRPLIKCNDCGVRIVEAKCCRTLEEWLRVPHSARWRPLVPDKVLGPELHFSPMVYVQFTKFKCGGMAIGYSWSHVLGDPVTGTNCINLWGRLLGGNPPPKSLLPHSAPTPTGRPARQAPASATPLSVKQVEPVGDHWLVTNACKMATDSITITESRLERLQSEKLNGVPAFEMISALFWRCLASVRRGGREPRVVTICRHKPRAKRCAQLSNEQMISTVSTSAASPADLDLAALAQLVSKQQVDETKLVEESIDGDGGKPDFVVYGANLTFVDMEGVDLSGLDIKGEKPVQVDCVIDGVGDEGAVLVFPRGADAGGGSKGGAAVLILPEDQIMKLKEVLKREFDIA
ncbi:protein ECERIFERUM 26-like [Musa acuminata AAA Group]|uniref:protein ECERIFERUM 26-like n=1 Tax=Musa acuminata AAA Group TaxID=214697 RepID=UPI0031DA82E2